MSKGLNKVMLIGRLGRDPEIRYTQGGMAVTNFTIATNEAWTDRGSGEKKERTEWHRIVAFGKLGEICGEMLSKGRLVYVEGRLQTRSWEQDGVTRYTTEIVANDMSILDPKGAGGGMPSQPDTSYDAGNSGGAPPSGGDSFDDDIPF